MMQMIAASGIEPVTDELRDADEDNPRGYLEFERVKQLKTDRDWVPEAVGKVVKVVHFHIPDLPTDQSYRVVFMHRRLEEVLASQARMLQRQGRHGADLSPEALKAAYQRQVERVLEQVRCAESFQLMEVWYHDVIASPRRHAEAVIDFLGGGLDVDAMVAAVDPTLYRNRAGETS